FLRDFLPVTTGVMTCVPSVAVPQDEQNLALALRALPQSAQNSMVRGLPGRGRARRSHPQSAGMPDSLTRATRSWARVAWKAIPVRPDAGLPPSRRYRPHDPVELLPGSRQRIGLSVPKRDRTPWKGDCRDY